MTKRKPAEEHHEEHADETWLIPYSDLLTLLLALFIVLFASSTLDKKKMGQMEAAFAAAFSGMSEETLNGTLGDLLTEAQGLDLGEGITLGSDSQGVVIELANLSLFASGSTELLKSASIPLNQVAALMQKPRYNRFRLVVEGHTDDVEATSSNTPSKWELSADRAAAVVRYLIKYGVLPERLQVVGMGDIAPQYPNYNAYNEPIPENRHKNRRIVIHIQP